MIGSFSSYEWPTDARHDYVCDKAECYESEYGSKDYYSECCYGHYEDDQLLDFTTGDASSYFGPTNKEVIKGTNPTLDDYDMPYIYANFAWDHCEEDFATTIETLYEQNVGTSGNDPTNKPTNKPTYKPTSSDKNAKDSEEGSADNSATDIFAAQTEEKKTSTSSTTKKSKSSKSSKRSSSGSTTSSKADGSELEVKEVAKKEGEDGDVETIVASSLSTTTDIFGALNEANKAEGAVEEEGESEKTETSDTDSESEGSRGSSSSSKNSKSKSKSKKANKKLKKAE